jgi:hypothetical protein
MIDNFLRLWDSAMQTKSIEEINSTIEEISSQVSTEV